MNYLEPLKINDIDLNKIYYTKIKENQNKKIIIIKYISDKNKLKNLVFQTPTLTNLNKPNIFNDYAELDILLESKSGNIDYFINFLNDLELKVKDDAKINASRWFTKNQDSYINFQKIIRDNNTIKVKLIKNNDFETIVQVNNEKRIDYDLIPENCWSKMILEFYAIWVNSNNDFGLFFRPILISFTIKNIYNYKFLEEESDSESNYNIPDTEVGNNIFLKPSNQMLSSSKNCETSQLECNILYNSLIEHSITKPVLEKNDTNETSDNNLSILKGGESSSSKSDKSERSSKSSKLVKSCRTGNPDGSSKSNLHNLDSSDSSLVSLKSSGSEK